MAALGVIAVEAHNSLPSPDDRRAHASPVMARKGGKLPNRSRRSSAKATRISRAWRVAQERGAAANVAYPWRPPLATKARTRFTWEGIPPVAHPRSPRAGLRELAKFKGANGFVADRVTVGLAQDFLGMRAQRWLSRMMRAIRRRASSIEASHEGLRCSGWQRCFTRWTSRFSSQTSISRLSLRPKDSISSARLS
jgi:hypothetical protein